MSELDASSLHITFLTEDEWKLAGALGFLQRTDQQFHWVNRGYASFDEFLGELSSSKRKNLRKERARVREEGVEFDWLTGRDITEAALGPFLRLLHGHGQPQMGPALSHPRIFQPHRREHGGPDAADHRASATDGRSPARSICSATACCSGATGAAPNTCRSCISRPAIIRPSISPSPAGFQARRGRRAGRAQIAARLYAGADLQRPFHRPSGPEARGRRFSDPRARSGGRTYRGAERARTVQEIEQARETPWPTIPTTSSPRSCAARFPA